jgi:cyanophycinase-like exopeptidase
VSGLICLQGGGEFSTGCRPMDARVVRRVAGGPAPVRVVVAALAGAPGREHDTAAAHGVAHYRNLGADAVAAPDARTDPAGAVQALTEAELVVLPGGSPARLLEALNETPVGALLAALVDRGTAVSGASAGAMVLGGWTVLPDRRGPDGPAVVPGLGLVADVVVVPHWSGGSSRRDWLRAVTSAVPQGTTVLGLPEESGVLVEGRSVTALGSTATHRLGDGLDLEPGTSWRRTGPAGR